MVFTSSTCLQWLTIIYRWCVDLAKSEPMLMLHTDLAALTPVADRKPPEKPASPCLVTQLPRAEGQPGQAAMRACQLLLIEAYCAFVRKGIFYVHYADDHCPGQSPPHPIQDPTGALFTALMVVRAQRPSDSLFADPAVKSRLGERVRRELAALLVVCQKMSMQGPWLPQYVRQVTQYFLHPNEWPRWENDWEKERVAFQCLEMQVLREPLLSLATTATPMGQVEREIERLLNLEKLSPETCAVLRGSAFFLLCSCLLDDTTRFDSMLASAGVEGAGKGCVSLMLTLLHTSGMAPGGRELQAREVLHRASYGKQADVAAQVILCAARGPCAKYLRVGPYGLRSKPPHPVQQLVSPDNLTRGAWVFSE